MYVMLDSGDMVIDPWFEWVWIYEHSKSRGGVGIERRRVQCSLYEQDGVLLYSTTYRATAFQSAGMIPGLVLGEYKEQVLRMHVFNVDMTCVDRLIGPVEYLKSWTGRLKCRIVDVNQVLSGSVTGKVYSGMVKVYS